MPRFPVLILFLLLLPATTGFPFGARADEIDRCGRYEVHGVVAILPEEGIALRIREGSQGEFILKMASRADGLRALPYARKPVRAVVDVERSPKGRRSAARVVSIEPAAPDPLERVRRAVARLSDLPCRAPSER